jgi:hypothetical protein
MHQGHFALAGAATPERERVQSQPARVSLSPMATVLKWNGKDLPDELRKLPEGRYVIESLDAVSALTLEEELGLEEALKELDRAKAST